MKPDIELREIARIADPFADDVQSAPLPPALSPTAASLSRARVSGLRALALLAAVAYDIGWIVRLKPHVSQRPGAVVVLVAAIPLLAGAVALGAGVRRGPFGLGEPASRIAALSLAALALFVSGMWCLTPYGASDAPFWIATYRCLALTLLFAAGPLLFTVAAFRHGIVGACAQRMAALGVACAAIGAATIGVVCPDGGTAHVLLGHGAMMLVMPAIGAYLGARVCAA